MHNLVELVIGVFVELVQVCSICCDTSGAGVVVLVPGTMSSSIMSSPSFAANTSWTPSHSSPESSEAMIAQSGCLCSSPRSRCCLCFSPRRRCRRSRCRLCSSPRRRCVCAGWNTDGSVHTGNKNSLSHKTGVCMRPKKN